jgi:hypothetical protein
MNFALILFLLTVFTGVLWVADRLIFAKQRRARAAKLLADFDSRKRLAGRSRSRAGAPQPRRGGDAPAGLARIHRELLPGHPAGLHAAVVPV